MMIQNASPSHLTVGVGNLPIDTLEVPADVLGGAGMIPGWMFVACA